MQAFVEVDGVLSRDDLLFPTLGFLHHCYSLTYACNIYSRFASLWTNTQIETCITGNRAEKITYLASDSENAAMPREGEETAAQEGNIQWGFHIQ